MFCADKFHCQLLKFEYFEDYCKFVTYFHFCRYLSLYRTIWRLQVGNKEVVAILSQDLIHSFCSSCRNKGKGPDPSGSNTDCNFCNVLTSD